MSALPMRTSPVFELMVNALAVSETIEYVRVSSLGSVALNGGATRMPSRTLMLMLNVVVASSKEGALLGSRWTAPVVVDAVSVLVP